MARTALSVLFWSICLTYASESASVDSTVPLLVNENGFSYKQTKFILLNCSLPDDNVTWSKNGIKLEETKTLKMTNENGVYILNITKPKERDIGIYTCNKSSNGKAIAKFRVAMGPKIVKLPMSFRIVEGENISLPCPCYIRDGDPTPSIEWRREGKDGKWGTLVADGHFTFEPNKGIVNGTLVIQQVKMEDRTNYMCYAFNKYGYHNSTTLLRVIDKYTHKYATLWPFLGICVELIVLYVLIFFCQKRRNKNHYEELDSENENKT